LRLWKRASRSVETIIHQLESGDLIPVKNNDINGGLFAQM